MRDLHSPILERLERLIRRGRRARVFDHRLSAGWLAVAFLGLMHAAADEVAGGRIDETDAGRALSYSIPRVFGVGARPRARTSVSEPPARPRRQSETRRR